MNQKREKMKNAIKPIVMCIVLVLAGTGAMNAQRGMGRMMQDTIRPGRMIHDTAMMGKRAEYMMQMRHMQAPPRCQMCPGCRAGMGPGQRHAMRPAGRPGIRPGMGWGPAPAFRGGMGQGQFNRPGIAPKPPMGRIENIPNLTDKQKKDIADLRLKQMEEFKKLREENLAKMKTLREEHRKKVIGLLTDEQKKSVDANSGSTAPETKKSGK
jgi:hypothetical protein